jgi:hypothetical protein
MTRFESQRHQQAAPIRQADFNRGGVPRTGSGTAALVFAAFTSTNSFGAAWVSRVQVLAILGQQHGDENCHTRQARY